MEDRVQLYNDIKKYELTPNEYFYILLKLSNHDDTMINTDHTKRILTRNGWLDFEGNLTIKTLECPLFSNQPAVFNKEVKTVTTYYDYINQYRNIFPAIRLPSGKMARASTQELEKRFDWFFRNYSYSWDVILRATKKYVESFEHQNYKYMQTSSYFIYKQEESKLRSSSLADCCDNDNVTESEQSYDVNV